jgi:hypothetical protein
LLLHKCELAYFRFEPHDDFHIAQEKGDYRIQAIRLESDQNIGRLKNKISALESEDDLLRTKLARMAKYIEDPVWRRVQEEIVRREYEKIQSRERSRQLELRRKRSGTSSLNYSNPRWQAQW